MISTKTYSHDALSVAKVEQGKSITLTFTGKSNDRDPSIFLTPILTEAINQSRDGAKEVVLDFSSLGYMNSSTITPIIKILDEAKKGNFRVAVLYNIAVKWQQLSFTALKIFETKDGRIRIVESE